MVIVKFRLSRDWKFLVDLPDPGANTSATNADILTAVTSTEGTQTLAGRVFATSKGRITRIGTFAIEAVPSGFKLVTKNRDVPGVIDQIGTVVGKAGVNISQFSLGRQHPGGRSVGRSGTRQLSRRKSARSTPQPRGDSSR